MAYPFVEKRKTTQEEMAYIVYMIVGSYFNKAKCKNSKIADRLYLYYAEMRESAQEKKEKKIITQVENVLKAYKKVLSTMTSEVMIHFRQDMYVLDFITGFERIHAEVDPKGYCVMQVL